MTAADLLLRAERRARTIRISSSAARVLAGVAVILAVWFHGRSTGRAEEQLAQINAQLDTNARVMAHHDRHRDTTKAEAAKAVAASDAQLVRTKAAQANVAIIDSATVRVVDPAASDAPTIDVTVPPVVVTEIREDRAQILKDRVTIAKLQDDNAALELKVTDRDERIRLLEKKLADVEGSAFRRGLKWGAAGALTLVGVAAAIF